MELSVVGKNAPRVDALEKVTGKAEFAIDFKLPHMLYGKIVRSPYAHAKIKRIDTTKAEKLAGVKVVATAKNIPPISLGMILTDRHAFPIDDKVRCVGDEVAAVAAETEEIAEEAASLVEVEYEELPAVFDTEEAFRTNPPAVVHPSLPDYKCLIKPPMVIWRLDPERPNVCQHFAIRHGDVERAFQEADLIIENRYSAPRLHHCQIEPSVCVAWVEPDGMLVLRAATHGIWQTRNVISRALQLPPSKVRIQAPIIGGSFGAKGRSLAEIYAALLSVKANGRPVRVCYTREEHFQSGHSRPPVVVYLKDGVKRDGTIIARESTILLDVGAYAEQAFMMAKNCAFGQVGIYRIPNFKLDSYGVYTNTPMSAPFRGFGNTETEWAIENQMNIIAEKLGIDPVDLRRRHILKEGERSVSGQITHSIGARECLDKVAAWIEVGKETPVEEGRWKKGKGVGLGNKYSVVDTPSSALVKVNPDGTLEVRHSSDEIGMGINTVVAQIAAEEFGLSVEQVKVISGDTAVVPYGWPPVSSRETFHMGNAVLIACRDAKRQLFGIAAPKLGVPMEQLEVRNRRIYMRGDPREKVAVWDLFSPPGLGYALTVGEIIGRGLFQGPGVPEHPETGQSERGVVFFCYGSYAVELAVDVETGEVRILRSAGAFDMGRPINPKMCEAQVEGGISMGIGSALYEQMIIEGGVVINNDFMDYKIPSSLDMPANQNITIILAGSPHREGPFGAKGHGEAVVIPYPPAVAQAIYNAIGIRIKDLPLTREKILKALKERKEGQSR